MDKLSFWGNSDDLAYFARNGSKLEQGYKDREADEIIEVGCWNMERGPNAIFEVSDVIQVVLTYSTHGPENKNACWRIGVVQKEQGIQIPDNWEFKYDTYKSRGKVYSMLLNINGVEEGVEVSQVNR